MCDEPVRTLVHTDEGDLPFQHYFVRLRCEPTVIDLSFVGERESKLTADVVEAINKRRSHRLLSEQPLRQHRSDT